MRKVPRHEFVPRDQKRAAYRNRPLPIGAGQTISQPYIVALMTDLLELEPERQGARDRHRLRLSVGGAGGARRHGPQHRDHRQPRARERRRRLARLGYANVETRIGDGYKGWPEAAPFDAIIVTAAPDHIPPALVEQLKPGGRLVIPVGTLSQELMVVRKNGDGTHAQRADRAGALRAADARDGIARSAPPITSTSM